MTLLLRGTLLCAMCKSGAHYTQWSNAYCVGYQPAHIRIGPTHEAHSTPQPGQSFISRSIAAPILALLIGVFAFLSPARAQFLIEFIGTPGSGQMTMSISKWAAPLITSGYGIGIVNRTNLDLFDGDLATTVPTSGQLVCKHTNQYRVWTNVRLKNNGSGQVDELFIGAASSEPTVVYIDGGVMLCSGSFTFNRDINDIAYSQDRWIVIDPGPVAQHGTVKVFSDYDLIIKKIPVPNIGISGAPPHALVTTPFTVTFTFARDVQSFNLGHINAALVNAEATELQTITPNRVFTALITPNGNGDIRIGLNGDTLEDLSGKKFPAPDPVTVQLVDETYVRQRTSRVISNFMARRADAITANQPDLTERLNGGGVETGEAGASFSGEGDYSNNRMNFRPACVRF